MKKVVLLLIFCTISLSAQNWTIVGKMPHPVYGAKAVVKDSLIFILGGYSYYENSPVDLIQQYNPQTEEWKTVGKMDAKRYGFVAGLYADSIIYCGGVSSEDSNSTDIEMWDGSQTATTYDSKNEFNRLFSTGVVEGENIYVFGGTALSTDQNYSVVYNIPSSKITYTNSSIFSKSFPIQQSCATLGNSIYIFGGIKYFLLKSIIRFDIKDNSFHTISAELEKPRAGSAAVVYDSSNIYLIGGFNETESTLSTVEVLQLRQHNDEVEEGPRLNYARRELTAVKYNNAIYVFGGRNKTGETVPEIEKLSVVTDVSENNKIGPSKFELKDNFPNPFNPSTQISFSINKPEYVTLNIYSILGEHIKTLVSENLQKGTYNYSWDGTDSFNQSVAAGVYLYRLSTKEFSAAKKMILLK